jgi:hypothetical protein
VAARFDAFISYSRAASSTLAVELRNGIERFAKPWYRLRSSRVFLDDASMSANTGLWSNIERGLTEAEWFILLCSPKAAASQYVTNEIAWWLEHKSADRILLVLDEGTMLWDGTAGDFDWKRSTAVNPALTKAFAEEPRWVEMPWWDAEGSLHAADPRFAERVADLASAVRGVERDELIGENVQQRRRALRLLRGGVIALSGLLVASLVATVIAVVNGNAAAEQARIALARQLAAQAITLSSTDLQTASLLAVEAQRMNDDAQTRAALFQLASASPQLVRTLPVGARVEATAIDADGTVYTGDADGAVTRWDDGEGTLLTDVNARVDSVSVSDDGAYVAAATDGDTVRIVTPSGDTELTVPRPFDDGVSLSLAALSPDGEYLTVTDRNVWLALFERTESDGEEFYTPIGTQRFGGHVGYGDGELTVFNRPGTWARISLTDGSVIADGFHILGAQSNGGALSADGAVMAGSLEKSINYSIWDTVGSVSGGGAVAGDPPDRIATTQVAGALDKVLDEHGTRLAVMIDGAIYVSAVREPGELPQAPLALLGAGAFNEETLSFRADTIVSSTGDFALVWDLRQTGRLGTEFEATVPEGCGACGPQRIQLDAGGSRAVLTAQGGDGPVVVDLESESSRVIDPEGTLGLGAAAWWDDRRLVVASIGENALFVTSPDLTEAEQAIPLPFDSTVSDISADADGTVTVLTDGGEMATLDSGTGEVVTSHSAFTDLLDEGSALNYDIAPDQSTAFVFVTDIADGLRVVDTATGDIVYEASAPEGAAYDAASRLHVFADGRETVLAADGTVLSTGNATVEDVPLPVISADGRLVATGGTNGTVSLLDLGRGGVVFGRIAVPVQENRLPVAAFTADGTAMVTSIPEMSSLDRPATVGRMTLRPTDWRASACAVAGRDLTSAEWQTYVGTAAPADLTCDR